MTLALKLADIDARRAHLKMQRDATVLDLQECRLKIQLAQRDKRPLPKPVWRELQKRIGEDTQAIRILDGHLGALRKEREEAERQAGYTIEKAFFEVAREVMLAAYHETLMQQARERQKQVQSSIPA